MCAALILDSGEYNRAMARGWESKSVEAQIESQSSNSGTANRVHLTPEQMEAQRQKQVLLLARKKIQSDLQSSQNPRHLEQLRSALAEIEARLGQLDRKG
jgi:hypothetical protein